MIESIIKFDINLISIILLVILFSITKIKKEIFSFSSALFSWIILANIVGLIIEPVTWLVDGATGNVYYFVGYLSNFILIITAPILIGLWASYLDYKLFSEKKRIQKYFYYQLPTFITFILLLINFSTPIIFSIDRQTNIYSYGDWFILRYVLTYGLFIHLIYLALKSRNKENYRVIIGMMIFLVLPATGAAIQFFNPSLLFAWSFLALSVMVIYAFLETTSGNKDYLTKVYSRKILEEYLNALIENNRDFQVIMIDLDRFKDVNDLYGHHMGDQVLIEFANILKNTQCMEHPFVSRLGGDEFLVVLEECTEEETSMYLKEIRINMKTNTLLSQFPFLSFSEGNIENNHKMSLDDFLTIADQLMYEEKNQDKKAN